MELLIAILFVTGVYLTLFITRPLFTLLHELGHAFAYLILTKPDKIDVFIGSYGDIDHNIKFKISKLNFYIKTTFPFVPPGGGCLSHKRETNYLNSIIITLAGPLFSLLITGIIGGIILNSSANNLIKVYWFCVIIYAAVGFYFNLRPKTNIIPGVNNDGHTLLFTYRIRNVYSEYISACEDHDAGQYENCIKKFLSLLDVFPNEEIFLRVLINCLLLTKRYAEAEKYLIDLDQYHVLRVTDHINLGYVRSLFDHHELAIENYRKALVIEPDHPTVLNNLGYELILKGDLNESRGLLEKALNTDPEYGYVHNNLGHLNILAGDLENGKRLIDRGLELEPENAYGYKNLAIYYLRMMDKEFAVCNLRKAIELDDTIKLEEDLKVLL